MGTMRHDRTSLWSYPRVDEAGIMAALGEKPSSHEKLEARRTRSAGIVALGGIAAGAALGLKLIGWSRAAKIVAWMVPIALLVGIYDELVQQRALAQG
jgi:hypothetical protein